METKFIEHIKNTIRTLISLYHTHKQSVNIESSKITLDVSDLDYSLILHNIGIIGDSLASGECYDENGKFKDKYNYSWLSVMCRTIGAKCKHYSYGGMSTKSFLNNEQRVSEFNNDNNLDSVIIALGTNDAHKISLDEFISNYKKIIEIVHSKYPYAPIFCMSLYNNDAKSNKFSFEIKKICECFKYCYYLDFIGNCPKELYRTSADTLFLKGNHYTGFGYIYIAKILHKVLNDTIIKNIQDFRFLPILSND